MAKYVDASEAMRLKRLKNIKSSLGNKMSHNDWQKEQIEKRRKDQLRQRREEAKRKPLGDGIRVDTKISKSDAISKCGLRLKAAFISKTQERKPKEMVPPQQKKSRTVLAEQDEENEEGRRRRFQSNNRRYSCDPIKRADNANNPGIIPRISSFPNLGTLKEAAPIPKKQQKKDSSTTRSQMDEDKENSGDSNSMSKDCATAADDVAVFPTKTKTVAPKYFMDIDSLKREHADAMKMLEELEASEGNDRRHSLLSDSENNSSKGTYPDNDDIDGCENYDLDDDLVGECDEIKGIISEGMDHAKEQDRASSQGDDAFTDSFLNMSHFSTSLVHRNSLDGEEEVDSHDNEGDGNLTPVDKNGSFADSDFFGEESARSEDADFDDEDDENGNCSRQSI